MKPRNSPPITVAKKEERKQIRAKPVEIVQACRRQERLLISELEATNSMEINAFGKPPRQLVFGMSRQSCLNICLRAAKHVGLACRRPPSFLAGSSCLGAAHRHGAGKNIFGQR